MSDVTLWGIHGGRTGDADSLFLRHNCVALGWARLGDLSRLSGTREAFKEAVAEHYPEKKPLAVANNAGQLFRFVHEMRTGDLVVYPSKADRKVHIGRVTGPFRYDPSLESGYPQVRPVTWLKAVPRTQFTQGALYEMGSAMSFFQIKTYADEIMEIVEGAATPKATPTVDETAAAVADDIEETTRDWVIKRLARDLKGHPLADFVAHLLNAMGYRCRVSPEGPDGGMTSSPIRTSWDLSRRSSKCRSRVQRVPSATPSSLPCTEKSKVAVASSAC